MAVPYAMIPERSVAPYAMPTVISNILPAFLPMSAIAGATMPRIISGTKKLRSWLKMSLKVMKILTHQSGNTSPKRMPNVIATNTCGSSPSLNFFFMYVILSLKLALSHEDKENL